MKRIHTIGVIGLQPRRFWHLLGGHGVRTLIDVRPNAISLGMYGRRSLTNGTRLRDLDYIAAPELARGAVGEMANAQLQAILNASPRGVCLVGTVAAHAGSRRARICQLAARLAAVTVIPLCWTPIQYPLPLDAPFAVEATPITTPHAQPANGRRRSA